MWFVKSDCFDIWIVLGVGWCIRVVKGDVGGEEVNNVCVNGVERGVGKWGWLG